ncbi:MAG: lactate utilization protein [Candidatus Uhrbacteria bacterium]|nr:lactate utilization protein [Candidatus Uhrbacteria bacterium]
MNYETLPNAEVIHKTVDALAGRGIKAIFVNDRVEAMEKVKSLIPKGASVMNGSSRTLEEIEFVDYLKSGNHGWKNLHEEILAEKDPLKQASLRKQAVLSDYYLGSVHAVAETGQLVIASNSGSQLPHVAFTSPNLIFVVGAQKIAPNLEMAMQRVREYVLPLEDQRMKDVGMGGSAISKLLIFEREPAFMERNVYVIFVNEKLGF